MWISFDQQRGNFDYLRQSNRRQTFTLSTDFSVPVRCHPLCITCKVNEWVGEWAGKSSCASAVLCAIILSAEARTATDNAGRTLWKSRLPIRAVKFLHMKSAADFQGAR